MIKPLHNEIVSQSTLPLYATGPLQLISDYQSVPPTPANTQAKTLISQDHIAARRQLVQAGQQFEAYFISYLMKVMRETVPDGALSGKFGAYFHSFYDQEIGLRAAEAGGIGITQMVQEHAEKYFAPPPARPSSSSR